MNFESRELQCVECGQSFDFSAEDQEFYSSRGFSEPKRCPKCRAARKAANQRSSRQQYSRY